jgi:dihydrofolate synthase/folylpolyglutamate synthase
MPTTLSDWIKLITTEHPQMIDLGLTRIKKVALLLNLTKPSATTTIIVGGTNGKGSCVAFLESIYLQAGYKTGAFISPILINFTEHVRVNGKDCNEQDYCDAFAVIKSAANKAQVSLSIFEYKALAALIIFQHTKPEVIILEVGLGGEKDAVNIIDADLAIITTIAIDHVQWLGNTREEIGATKAGIFRPHQLAVCGDPDPPHSLIEYANQLGTKLYVAGRDFTWKIEDDHWTWSSNPLLHELVAPERITHGQVATCPYDNVNLPLPKLPLQNAATVLMAIQLLQSKLPVELTAIKKGIATAFAPGRYQIMQLRDITVIFDVAHNPQSCEYLANKLRHDYPQQTITAVIGMLADKDIKTCCTYFSDLIKTWYIASLNVPRGATAATVQPAILAANAAAKTILFNAPISAYQQCVNTAAKNSIIVVFGSFHTVGQIIINYEL